MHGVRLPTFRVLHANPLQLPITLHKLRTAQVVQHKGAVVFRGPGERQRKPRIIKLPIVVQHPALQATFRDARDAVTCFPCTQDPRRPQRRFARKQVVQL